jgi:hypothetical protein
MADQRGQFRTRRRRDRRSKGGVGPGKINTRASSNGLRRS